MTKKNLFLAFLTAILVVPLLAHGQTKHRPDKDDDDDDDRPVFRPPALRPGEKPLDADFTCPYVKGFEHPERFNGYTTASESRNQNTNGSLPRRRHLARGKAPHCRARLGAKGG